MKKVFLSAGIFVTMVLNVPFVYAQYSESADTVSMSSDVSYAGSGDVIQIPPGMQIIKSGDVRVVVPKDSQLRRVNDLFLIESAEEYAARKFEVTERRLDQLEKDQAEIKKELKRLQSER